MTFLFRDILSWDSYTAYILKDTFQRATNQTRAPKDISIDGEMYIYHKVSAKETKFLAPACWAMYRNQAGKILKILS